MLSCSYNKLTSLPDNLRMLVCIHNPLNDIIGNITSLKLKKWNHFRDFFFLSKLRKKFISWMWKSRETKIKQLCNPIHLQNILNEDCETFHNFLDSFGIYKYSI
jgi:hypothetical protein